MSGMLIPPFGQRVRGLGQVHIGGRKWYSYGKTALSSKQDRHLWQISCFVSLFCLAA